MTKTQEYSYETPASSYLSLIHFTSVAAPATLSTHCPKPILVVPSGTSEAAAERNIYPALRKGHSEQTSIDCVCPDGVSATQCIQ